MKEHDLILTLLSSGPNISAADLQAAGYTPDNTSVETDEKEYKNFKVVRDNFKNEDGTFDEEGFHNYYLAAEAVYNGLSKKHTIEELYNQTFFKANDVLAPQEGKKREGPDINFIKMLNPGRDSWSTSTLGEWKEGTESIDEIAQSNKVLANPVDVANGAKPIWHDSPNDSFWTDFFDTRVLAQWDFDADENGKPTNDPNQIVYHKGSLKLNDKGEYYYENLQGRDIYGRKVLNKMNTLTVDGSDVNKYDFFDSDSKYEKNPYGTLMKNLALVGTMFIPYVGPVIAATSMITQVTGMAAKLGKMAFGSDNPTLSAIEGWTESWNRQTLKSEYAQNNTWCWENMIDVVGDLVGQLKEQRVIFEYVPAIFKGARAIEWGKGFTKDAEKKFLGELAQEWSKKNGHKALSAALKTQEGKYLALEFNDLASAGAQVAYRQYMKDYYKIGEVLSKTYMAGLISSNMYAEAKANGVSDEAAAWMTLGRFGAEMGLLFTPVGNAILPEVRANKLAERAIFESAVPKASLFAKVNQIEASNVSKMSKFKDIFKIGNKLADRGAERVYANNLIDTFKASFANGTEVGIVNDIEEFLTDVTKTAYNSIADDSAPKMEAWTNMVDRYGMGMVSGLVGGTLTSAFTNYGQIAQARATTPEQAIQQMVYLERQGELDKIMKNLDKYTLGYKNLSATDYDIIVDKDGTEKVIWKAGTKDNNQDLAAKQAIRLQANLVKQILSNNGIKLTDESFLKSQTPEFIKEIKFGQLINSVSAGRLLQKFNTICSDIVRYTNEINNAQPKTDAKKAQAKKSEGETIEEQSIEEKKKLLKEAVKIKDDILNGKYSQEFIRDVIYELSPAINHAFIKPSFIRYAEYVKKKPIDQIPENELNDLKAKWEAWKQTDMKDYLHISAGIHQQIVEKSADIVKKANEILNDSNDPVLRMIQNFQAFGFEGRMNAAIEEQKNAGVEITPELYSQIAKGLIENTYADLGLALYKSLNSEQNFETLNQLVLEYTQTQNDQTQTQRHKELGEQITSIIQDNFNRNIGKIVNPIIERGYINSEVRNVVLDILQQELKRNIENLAKFDYIAQLTPAEQTQKTELEGIVKEIKTSIDKINELPHTPIEELLNEFSITVKGNPLSVTELIDKLNGILKGSTEDPSAVLLGNEISEQINQAIQLLDVFEAVIEGAKNDSGQMNNLLGYNHYLNLLMPETNAPEISTESGNILIQDIRTLRNKLQFFKDLNAQNQAQKIGTNHRVQLNFNYLTYERLKSIKIPDSWKGKEEWKSALAEAENLEQAIQKKSLGISPENRNAINLEMLKIQNALYELINKNLENLEELFSIKNFNYFDNTSNIFNESSEALNDASLLGWIIDSGALRFDSFKKMLIEARDGKIAPIASQELAAYKQLGRIINGKFYKLAYDAIRHNIIDYWNNLSKDERINFLKTHTNYTQDSIDKLADRDDILNFTQTLRYLNEIFTEGIPGSGKTNAVLPITLKIIQNNYKDLLKNVAYIHGGNVESAGLGIENLKALGIDTSGFTAYDKSKFLTRISEWTQYEQADGLDVIPENRIKIDQETKEFRSSDKIKYDDNPFTLIIFDEATNANTFEHDVIDAYGNQYGTTTLSFGDLDQDGSYGIAKLSGNSYKIGINPVNFFPGLKLGVSMRVNNSQKAQNLKTAQKWVNSLDDNTLELHYYEDENGLYGEKVISVDPDNIDITNTIQNSIQQLINTVKPGQKIGFITNDMQSLVAIELSQDKYKDIIEIFDTNVRSPQGLESQYYIVDITSDEATKDFRRHVYTGISRSSQGTLIFDYALNDEGVKVDLFKNIEDSETINQELPVEQIKELSDKDTEFWSEHVKNAEIPKLQNTDKLPDIPKPDAPVIDEGNGEVHIEVIPTLEKQEVVEQQIREESKTKEPEFKVEEKNNAFSISLLYYTFNKFETGIYKGDNGKALQWGQDILRHKNRIDSANGLIHLDEAAGKPRRTFNKYRIILDQLHSALLNAKDVFDLNQKIEKILKDNNFEIDKISVKFGFKSSAKPHDREFSSKDGSTHSRFDKGNKETVEYIHARDTKSLDVNYKSIVLMVGDSTRGDFLEIPYIQLPHVGTVIDKLPNEPHTQIKQLWDSIKSHDDAVGELLSEMDRLGLKAQYPDLFKLGEVFRITNNVFVDLHDWNPYTKLKDLGIQGVYSEAGTEYGRPGYTYDVPFIPISQLAENSEINISPILYSKTDSINDGTNNYEHVVKPGLPFVLVSYDKSVDLISSWLNGDGKVQMVYVVPPRATIEQYFDNLVNIFEKNRPMIEDIGNDVTAYRLTQALLANEKFRNDVSYNLKEREFVKLDQLIKDLEGLDQKTLVRKLQTQPEGHSRTYKEQFRLFLKELVKPTGQVILKYKGFNSVPNRQLIVETLTNAGIDGVYYQVRPPKTGESVFGRFFFKADQNNDWTLTTSTGQKLSYTIHGKIDSNVYEGDSSILDTILGAVSLNSAGMWTGDANAAYIQGRYTMSVQNASYKVGDSILLNNKQYIITDIKNGKYELSGDFGRSSTSIDINSGNSQFAPVQQIQSVYKISDTVISPDNTPYLVIDVDSNNYLLQDINTSQQRIESKQIVENWTNQQPTTKFKIGDKITNLGFTYTVTDIYKADTGEWYYFLDNELGETISTVDSSYELYQFEPKATIQNNKLVVDVSEGLTLNAELEQSVLDNLMIANNTGISQNTDNSIVVTFDNGTKIVIKYDPDSSEHEATVYTTQEQSVKYTQNDIDTLKSRNPDIAEDLDEMTVENASSLYKEVIEGILEDVTDGELNMSEEDVKILKDLLESKDINECNGINLKFT